MRTKLKPALTVEMVEKTVDETEEVRVDRSFSNLPRALDTSMIGKDVSAATVCQPESVLTHFVVDSAAALCLLLTITLDACEQVVVLIEVGLEVCCCCCCTL